MLMHEFLRPVPEAFRSTSPSSATIGGEIYQRWIGGSSRESLHIVAAKHFVRLSSLTVDIVLPELQSD